MNSIIIYCMVLLLIPDLCYSNDLPSYLPNCYIDDPELNDCMLRAFHDVRDRARQGIEEIGLRPLHKILTHLIVNQKTPSANYTANSTDFTIIGLDNYEIKEFQYDPGAMTAHVRLRFEDIRIETHCNFNGHVALISVEGFGFFDCSFGPIEAHLYVKGQMRRSRGINFYKTKDVDVNLKIDQGNCTIANFFQDNEQLNNLTNRLLTATSNLIAEAFTPPMEKIAEIGVRRFVEYFTSKVPYNKILPRLHNNLK